MRASVRTLPARAAGILAVATAIAAVLPGTVKGKIVYPPDSALLKGDGKVEVLAFRPAAAGAARLAVVQKGGSMEYPAGPGVVRVNVTVYPGKNALQLDGETVNVFLAAAGAGEPPPGFEIPDAHATDNGCEDCHRIEKEKAPLLDPGARLCLRCHDDVTEVKGKTPVLHPPAEEGDCFSCHKFHGASIKQLSAPARRALCFECHDNFADAAPGGRKPRLHRPAERGECTGCHNPHAAPYAKLLPAQGDALCLRCHKNPAKTPEGKDWAVPHAGLDEGCATCHLVHASDQPRLLRKAQAPLCYDCHDSFAGAAGGRTVHLHPPVEEGECSGCHRPHGGALKKLLAAAPEKALCLSCHDDPSLSPGGGEWAFPHPALDDGCPTCHVPHASGTPRLLKNPEAPLCFECHDSFVASSEGKTLQLHRPVASGECAGCHRPHGSGEKKLLAAAPDKALCLRCHKDPAKAPDGADWAVPHPALDDGCPSCHLPHVSEAPGLLKSAQGPLCAGCHEDKNVNPDGAAWATPHPPVARGMCASCHGPHGAPEKPLLARSGNEVCRSCHQEPHERHRSVEMDAFTGRASEEKAVLPQGFPVNRAGVLGCGGCHLPHGSDDPRLWNRGEQVFCGACHRNY